MDYYFRYKKSILRITRFVISGITGFSVNLGLFSILANKLDINYLLASIIAFSTSMIISFIMQKYWTYEDPSHSNISRQIITFVLVFLGNTAINSLIVYFMVSHLEIQNLLAQFISGTLIACESFFVYRKYIFSRNQPLV